MLLGRQAESVALDRLLQSARSGNGRAIVVHGEPGIGKSALLDHAMAEATGSFARPKVTARSLCEQ